MALIIDLDDLQHGFRRRLVWHYCGQVGCHLVRRHSA
jgi:hypothetical protein